MVVTFRSCRKLAFWAAMTEEDRRPWGGPSSAGCPLIQSADGSHQVTPPCASEDGRGDSAARRPLLVAHRYLSRPHFRIEVSAPPRVQLGFGGGTNSEVTVVAARTPPGTKLFVTFTQLGKNPTLVRSCYDPIRTTATIHDPVTTASTTVKALRVVASGTEYSSEDPPPSSSATEFRRAPPCVAIDVAKVIVANSGALVRVVAMLQSRGGGGRGSYAVGRLDIAHLCFPKDVAVFAPGPGKAIGGGLPAFVLSAHLILHFGPRALPPPTTAIPPPFQSAAAMRGGGGSGLPTTLTPQGTSSVLSTSSTAPSAAADMRYGALCLPLDARPTDAARSEEGPNVRTTGSQMLFPDDEDDDDLAPPPPSSVIRNARSVAVVAGGVPVLPMVNSSIPATQMYGGDDDAAADAPWWGGDGRAERSAVERLRDQLPADRKARSVAAAMAAAASPGDASFSAAKKERKPRGGAPAAAVSPGGGPEAPPRPVRAKKRAASPGPTAMGGFPGHIVLPTMDEGDADVGRQEAAAVAAGPTTIAAPPPRRGGPPPHDAATTTPARPGWPSAVASGVAGGGGPAIRFGSRRMSDSEDDDHDGRGGVVDRAATASERDRFVPTAHRPETVAIAATASAPPTTVAAATATAKVWEWKCRVNAPEDDPRSWTRYPADVTTRLEAAYRAACSGGSGGAVKLDAAYSVVFRDADVGMVQFRNDDPKRFRPVRRRTAGSEEGPGLPDESRIKRLRIVFPSATKKEAEERDGDGGSSDRSGGPIAAGARRARRKVATRDAAKAARKRRRRDPDAEVSSSGDDEYVKDGWLVSDDEVSSGSAESVGSSSSDTSLVTTSSSSTDSSDRRARRREKKTKG